MHTKTMLVLLAALLTFATGCGEDCVDACENTRACLTGTTTTTCDDICDTSAAEAESAGCTTQFDDLNACLADATEACSDATCGSETEALGRCALPFCTDNPDSSLCN